MQINFFCIVQFIVLSCLLCCCCSTAFLPCKLLPKLSERHFVFFTLIHSFVIKYTLPTCVLSPTYCLPVFAKVSDAASMCSLSHLVDWQMHCTCKEPLQHLHCSPQMFLKWPLIQPVTHTLMAGCCHARNCQPLWEQLWTQCLAQGHFKCAESWSWDLNPQPFDY